MALPSYDLCVIGAGPGGISAAIRGASRGARVCLVDPGPLGGTCLNRGCIPARAMGTTAKLMAQIQKAESVGIELLGQVKVSLAAVVARKERILRRLRAGLESLIRDNGVTWLAGVGILQSAHEVEVQGLGPGTQGLKALAIVLATGSKAGGLPGCPVDGKTVITSDELLEATDLPKNLVVVGGGVVGSEFSSYFCDLGVPVTLVELADRVLPFEDERISAAFHESLKRRGAAILTSTKVEGIGLTATGEAKVSLSSGKNLTASKVLVAAGRTPQVPQGCESLGLSLKEGGMPVDETLRTRVSNIFAIGDLLGRYQLACTASYEGALAAQNAAGDSKKARYEAVPDVIYTEPEIASVGWTEAEAREQGRSVKVSTLSLTGFARAQTLEETEGFVQVVAEEKGGTLLGVQIIGARATDLIGEAALAIKQGLTLRSLVETLHGHPTMSESLWEASAMALGQSIYYARPR